jgi:hypothetical protein
MPRRYFTSARKLSDPLSPPVNAAPPDAPAQDAKRARVRTTEEKNEAARNAEAFKARNNKAQLEARFRAEEQQRLAREEARKKKEAEAFSKARIKHYVENRANVANYSRTRGCIVCLEMLIESALDSATKTQQEAEAIMSRYPAVWTPMNDERNAPGDDICQWHKYPLFNYSLD